MLLISKHAVFWLEKWIRQYAVNEVKYIGKNRIFSYISKEKRDEQGKEIDTEVQTIALYYCPKCYKFTALNNMA